MPSDVQALLHVLPRTLDSLLAQSHSDFELIINDDCSPDDTAEVWSRSMLSGTGAFSIPLRNPVNLRYAQKTRNAAILRANHECRVAIRHDGDVYRPDLIEKWTRGTLVGATARPPLCSTRSESCRRRGAHDPHSTGTPTARSFPG